jgi:hypothetical protein
LPDADNPLVKTSRFSGKTRSFKVAAHLGKLACTDKFTAQAEQVRGMRKRGCIRMFGCVIKRLDQPRRIGKIAFHQPGNDSRSPGVSI